MVETYFMLITRLTKYALLLFPVFAVSVRHWISGLFGVFVLLGLVYLSKLQVSSKPLRKEEKIFIAILIGYFVVFLISSAVNGWGESGNYALGTELRFIFIIPVFLLLRNILGAERYLLAGSIFGALVGGVQGLLDVFVFGNRMAWGFYGHLFIGPVTMLMVGLLIPAIRVLKPDKRLWPVLAGVALLGLTTVILSTARSAYLAFIILGVISIIYYLRGRTAIVVFIVFTVLMISTYMTIDKIQQRINVGVDEVTAYIDTLEKFPDEPEKQTMGSIGLRLEMWRATKYYFAESPWFGVGRFNYKYKMREYIKKGLVNSKLVNAPHAHNLYFNTLAEKGIVGLVFVLLLLYYPLYVFIRTRHASRDSAFAGIVLITALTIFSLTEAATLIKGNFVAITLIYLSVFFTWHIREVYKKREIGIEG